MVRITCSDEFKELRAVVKVIGLGGGGGNAINRMAEANLYDVELISANTDAQDLRRSKAHLRIQLGESLTRGLGVGGNPEAGRMAALESEPQIKEVLRGADLVFITAGMGGGTGTGAAPIAARIARECSALTIGVVTRPFSQEGQHRAQQAEKGIQALREYVDTILTIPNDRLYEVLDEGTSMEAAFHKADEVLRQAVQSLSEVITRPGVNNMDLADIRSIMTGAGEALMGMGESEGPNRAIEAAKEAIASPLLENVSINGAKGLLVNFVASQRISLNDFKDAMSFVTAAASPEAKVKFGIIRDETMGERLRVTVVATGFPARRPAGFRPAGRLLGGLAPRVFEPLEPMASFGPNPARTQPADWTKPAFTHWKVRKLK